MTFRSLMAACMVVGALGLAGCNASGSVSVQPNTPAAASTAGTTTSARSNFDLADTEVKATTASDLTLYRCEFDEANKVWIYFYFSPSQNKSYRCKKHGNDKVEVVEVTGAEAHSGSQTIDQSNWKVDSTQVQTIVNQTINVNVTNNVTNITNLTLISAEECKNRTGKDADGPVWVAIVNNTDTYISANTGNVIVQVPTTGATPMPSTAPSTTPSTTPSATPSASADMALMATATLTGAEQNPPVETAATGTVTATLSADRMSLTLSATATGLSGPITGAHIHAGAKGANGAVVRDLTVNGNTVTTTWTATDATQPLTAELAAQLVAGTTYINLHTAAHPDGEIRAQLVFATQ